MVKQFFESPIVVTAENGCLLGNRECRDRSLSKLRRRQCDGTWRWIEWRRKRQRISKEN